MEGSQNHPGQMDAGWNPARTASRSAVNQSTLRAATGRQSAGVTPSRRASAFGPEEFVGLGSRARGVGPGPASSFTVLGRNTVRPAVAADQGEVFVIGKFIAIAIAIIGTGVVVGTARDTEIAVREPTRPGKQRVSNRCISGPIRCGNERLRPPPSAFR